MGIGLAQMLGLITFPILTRALTKDQYGVMSLVTTTILFAVAISKAGLSDGMIRFYKEYSASLERRTIFASTVLMRGLVFSLVSVVLYIAILPVFSHYLGFTRNYMICFSVMALYLFIRPLNIIIMNFIRVNDRTFFLNGVNLLLTCFSIGLSLVLLLYVFRELYGFFIGGVIGEFIAASVFFYWFFKQYSIIPSAASGDLAKQLIKFGLPLLIGECAFLALSYADRYLILAYYNESVLGLYSVGYNLAMYIANLIMFSITYAIVPIYVDLYGTEGREKTEAFLGKCLRYLIIALIPICFGYLAVCRDLFITLASDKYADAASFSPIILVGTIVFALNSVFNAGLYLAKKTAIMLGIMLLAVVVKIAMNVLLLPAYGVMGAAIATLIPCVMVTLLNAYLSSKYIRVKIDVKSIIYYGALSIVMLFVLRYIDTSIASINLVLKVFVGIMIMSLGAYYKEKDVVLFFKSHFKRMTSYSHKFSG